MENVMSSLHHEADPGDGRNRTFLVREAWKQVVDLPISADCAVLVSAFVPSPESSALLMQALFVQDRCLSTSSWTL